MALVGGNSPIRARGEPPSRWSDMAEVAIGRHGPGAVLPALVLRSPLHQVGRYVSGLLDLKDTGVTFLRPVSVIRGRGAWSCMMKLGFGVTDVGVVGLGQIFLIGRPERSEPAST